MSNCLQMITSCCLVLLSVGYRRWQFQLFVEGFGYLHGAPHIEFTGNESSIWGVTYNPQSLKALVFKYATFSLSKAGSLEEDVSSKPTPKNSILARMGSTFISIWDQSSLMQRNIHCETSRQSWAWIAFQFPSSSWPPNSYGLCKKTAPFLWMFPMGVQKRYESIGRVVLVGLIQVQYCWNKPSVISLFSSGSIIHDPIRGSINDSRAYNKYQ